MYRKYVILSLAFVFALGATGCTSKRTEGDEADVEASTDDGLEVADANENNSDLDVAGDDKSAAPSGDDLSPAEQLPADPSATADNSAQVAPGDISETPPADAPPSDATTTPPPTEMAADQPTPTEDPTASATPTPDPIAAPTPEPSAPAPAPVQASLQKIKDHPYHSGKILVNAVYIARKGDSPKAISQKVFGTDGRVKELCRVNASNCKRSTKVGDKFYYNSPQRPTDEENLKTFYEDAGVQPETYTAKSGDNIRKVGKQLLGDSRSWMELWATNSVESKGALDEGTQLRYWSGANVTAPALAKTDGAGASPEAAETGDGAPPAPGAPGDMAANGAPPSDGPDAGQPPPPAELPPAPNADPNMQAANGAPPPPPPGGAGAAGAAAPGSMEAAPPPPPPPPAVPEPPKPPAAEAAAVEGTDPNQTMALGVGAVLLLAAAALFISIRKKRQRRQIDYTATQTQIDG